VRRPRHALTGVVAVVGGTALVGCVVQLIRADLSLGTRLAALGLWLLAALAVATLTGYVREVERHRRSTHRGDGPSPRGGRRVRGAQRSGSWKPLPGLVLLWVGGLTALAVFPFMLSGGATARSSAPAQEAGGAVVTAQTSATSPAVPRSAATSVSRSTSRPTRSATAPRPTATTALPVPVATATSSQWRPTSPSSTSATVTPGPTATSSPTTPSSRTATTVNPGGITITLLPKPTKTKG